jgi:hypothetical protein
MAAGSNNREQSVRRSAQEKSAGAYCNTIIIQPTDRRAQCAASTRIVTRVLAKWRHSAATIFFVLEILADF